jgi:hypothetical protein
MSSPECCQLNVSLHIRDARVITDRKKAILFAYGIYHKALSLIYIYIYIYIYIFKISFLGGLDCYLGQDYDLNL